MTDFIYCLRCPETGDIRYIGKTRNPKTRLAAHISKAKGMHLRHHCSEWIRSIIAIGLKPELDVIFEVPAGENWEFHEKRLISEYREAGHNLVNLTGGGVGFFQPSPELLALRGKARSKFLREHPEAKGNLLAAIAASWADPVRRAERVEAVKAAWRDPDKKSRFIRGDERAGGKAAARRRFKAEI